MRRGLGCGLIVVLAATMAGPLWASPVKTIDKASSVKPQRVLSLDQCADQYVLALAPQATLALSPRADDADAWLQTEARGRRQVRPTLEAAVGFRPDVVVRYWGGDARLLRRLEATGVRVVTIDDATDFDGIRTNIARVAGALGRDEAGRALIQRMDGRLAEAQPVRARTQPTAQYLTAGGFTAGPGTLVQAILTAAGFGNASRAPGYAPVRLESLALKPPARFVLGFFDQFRADRRGVGRHPVVRRVSEGRVAARLPAAALTCPAWFAADAAVMVKGGR